jgi:hypothetical protein
VSIVTVKEPLIEAVKPKTNWFVVLRSFEGNNIRYIRGEVVDTLGWRHTSMLEQRRYIAPLPYGAEVPEEKEVEGAKRRMIEYQQTDTNKKSRKKN